MLQKTSIRLSQVFFSCLVLCLTFLSINSCKKTDSLVSVDRKEVIKETPENFFKLPDNLSPILKRIAKELERQNKSKEFITAFIAKEGFPVWAKSRIEKHKSKPDSFDGEGLEDTTVYIPLVVSADKYVTGFLKATVDDSIDIKIFRQNDYINFPFATPQSSPNVTTAENYAVRMMTMDRDVFGSTEFKIADDRLFHNSTDYSDTVGLQRYIILNDSTGMGGEGFANGTTVSNLQNEVCWTENTYRYVCGNAFNGNGNTQNTVARCGWEISGTLTVCTTFEIPENGPGGGGSGGGGGGGSWPYPPNGPGGGGAPCVEQFGESISNSFVPIECNPSGGNPWPSRDANGYLYSRLTELYLKLSQNPYALEPCDSLNIMPLDPVTGYGAMYQRVAQFNPSQYILDRVDSIRSVAPNWIVDNFNIQSLEDAFGPLVNCDFFPVRITALPPGMSPNSLLEYFRMNLTDSFSRGSGVTFYPYLDLPHFSDATRWNLPDTNSLGALVHIQILGNDGSVILSDYTHNYNNGYQHHRFKFSTMETPFDAEHPVAGTREFGIYNVSSLPGEFTFYTMGVDRTWDLGSQIQNSLFGGFGHADALWQKVQQNLISFINNQGGQASYYSNHQIVARPKWNEVKRYLREEISFTQLKVLLGC